MQSNISSSVSHLTALIIKPVRSQYKSSFSCATCAVWAASAAPIIRTPPFALAALAGMLRFSTAEAAVRVAASLLDKALFSADNVFVSAVSVLLSADSVFFSAMSILFSERASDREAFSCAIWAWRLATSVVFDSSFFLSVLDSFVRVACVAISAFKVATRLLDPASV